MKKVDVLFLNPGDQVKTFQGLAKKHTPLSTPSWCMLLASSLRKYAEVAIYDANIQGWDAKKLFATTFSIPFFCFKFIKCFFNCFSWNRFVNI